MKKIIGANLSLLEREFNIYYDCQVLNFIANKIETVTNDEYITSVQVMELLEKLATQYAKIYIILDNASCQRAKVVQEKAAELGIKLIFLPSYSPNLNFIERVWKFVKAEVINTAYIETFEDYCEKISYFVDNIHTLHPEEMNTLITEKFQLFDDCSVI